MIKGPSNQKTYSEYYSGDPAFRQLADAATDDEVKAHVAELERARETGDWSGLLLDGKAPTTFLMRPMPGEAWREIMARIGAGEQAVKVAPIAFRACITKIENGGHDGPLKREQHPQLGNVATVAVTNYLDSIDTGIVTELGVILITRGTQGLSPKS